MPSSRIPLSGELCWTAWSPRPLSSSAPQATRIAKRSWAIPRGLRPRPPRRLKNDDSGIRWFRDDQKPFAWRALNRRFRGSPCLYTSRQTSRVARHRPARFLFPRRRAAHCSDVGSAWVIPKALLGGFLMTRLGPVGITLQRGSCPSGLGGESI